MKRALLWGSLVWLVTLVAFGAFFWIWHDRVSSAVGWLWPSLPPLPPSILGTGIFVSFLPDKTRTAPAGAVFGAGSCTLAVLLTVAVTSVMLGRPGGDLPVWGPALLVFVYAGLPAIACATLLGAVVGHAVRALDQHRRWQEAKRGMKP